MVGPFPFLKRVQDAISAPRPLGGLRPAEMDRMLREDLGPKWALLWNQLLGYWTIYRLENMHRPEPIFEFVSFNGTKRLLPMTRKAIWHIKHVLEMNADYHRLALAQLIAGNRACDEQDRQLRGFLHNLLSEAKHSHSLHSSVQVPRDPS